jgi:demethylmenaquinone methyltransferase/2-methoxy-6-polyprenyl-1,4-benzoquinol methylase
LEAIRQQSSCRVVAADFTIEMMKAGQKRDINRRDQEISALFWCSADALQLPFPREIFDAVVSGFLMRNVVDINQCLDEQSRVLKPGGQLVILDTTRPQSGLFTPLVQAQLRLVIPALGRLLTGHADAYSYLPGSTQAFLTAEELATRLSSAGFQRVGFRRRMLGTIAIHWATKPSSTDR